MDHFKIHPLFKEQTQEGKQALKREHRPLIKENKKHRAVQSLDFDRSIEGRHLQHKRWDYMIETNSKKTVAFEVHTFHKTALLEKKNGTIAILKAEFPEQMPTINSWHVAALGALPRQDLLARFQAETQINIHRQLDLSKV